ALLDEELDLHLGQVRGEDHPPADARVEEAALAVVALDACDVLLHAPRVILPVATEQAEGPVDRRGDLLAQGRGEQGKLGEAVGADEVDVAHPDARTFDDIDGVRVRLFVPKITIFISRSIARL